MLFYEWRSEKVLSWRAEAAVRRLLGDRKPKRGHYIKYWKGDLGSVMLSHMGGRETRHEVQVISYGKPETLKKVRESVLANHSGIEVSQVSSLVSNLYGLAFNIRLK